MMKDRKGLQLIEGFRHSLSGTKPSRADQDSLALQGGDFAHFQMREPVKDGLTSALKATERRLSMLLEDRNRIGRDLHDCVLQSLYAIGLNLAAARRVNPRDPPEIQESYDRIIEQLNRLIHEVRGMVQSLERGTVQEFDLASEISTLSEIYEQAGQLRIELDLQPKAIEILTNEEEQEILNIVREALSNCVRHANATRATVSIRSRGTRVRVSISDDGTGFVTADLAHRGFGLGNMAARARKIGGTLRVQSKLGRGTHIIAEFSLEPILTPV